MKKVRDSLFLPGTNFPEKGEGLILGFGTASSPGCQTNHIGPAQFEPCICTKDKKSSDDQGNCCSLDQPPKPHGELCQSNGLMNMSSGEVIIIQGNSNEKQVSCYPLSLNEFGWCETRNNTWGYCQASCRRHSPDEDVNGQLRMKRVQILDQEFCDSDLRRVARAKNISSFEIEPKILCVGFNYSNTASCFRENERGDFNACGTVEKSPPWFVSDSGSYYDLLFLYERFSRVFVCEKVHVSEIPEAHYSRKLGQT